MPLSKPILDYYFDPPPTLLYRVQLDHQPSLPGLPVLVGQPVPTVDSLNLQPTFVFAHPVGAQTRYMFEVDGLHLQVVVPPETQGPAALLWNFSPVPRQVLAYYISADFQLVTSSKARDPFAPFAPYGLGELWASSVFVRDGEPTVTDQNTTLVGATHQVIGSDVGFSGPKVSLGAGGATPGSVFPMAKDVAVLATLAHDASRTFSLGTLIDCSTGQGRSHLKTSGGYYWENTFTHPFTLFAGSTPKSSRAITCAGCGVAIGNGSGTAQVMVKEFRVQAWLPPGGSEVP